MKSAPKQKITYKTEWDFSNFYKGPEDPKLSADICKSEKALSAFAKKYAKNQTYLKDKNALLKALKDYEKLLEEAGSSLPIFYLYNLKNIDSTNKKIDAQISLLESRYVKASNQTLFFTLSLGKIDLQFQKQILKDVDLKHYRYFLKRIFDNAKYQLTEAEEKILNLKYQPAHEMWVSGMGSVLGDLTVEYKGEKLPLPKAGNMIQDLPLKNRRLLHKKTLETLKSVAFFAEHEINAIYTDKKIDDELRGLKEPYSATIIGYENDEKTIMSMIDLVTKSFKISHRFFKLKAKLLKLPSLEYSDRNVGIGKNEKKIAFEKAIEILENSFEKTGPFYAKTFKEMLTLGRIDVYPKKGKQGGAYCWGGSHTPTLVFLNYTGSLNGVTTFAHEMGHAFHTELSKKQPPLYEHYTIASAEVASTFFESVVLEDMMKSLSEKEKVIALHDKIQDFVTTAFRQIACFNFELELHRAIRTKGALSKKEIAEIHNKNMSAYLGPSVKMQELDGYMFVQWGHIRRFFYVYSYAFGLMISQALYANYKKDPSYIKKVEEFLAAGKSASPEDIFASVGIDIKKPEFFRDALQLVEKDIVELEKLAKKAGMI